jgi:hypothetical protein
MIETSNKFSVVVHCGSCFIITAEFRIQDVFINSVVEFVILGEQSITLTSRFAVISDSEMMSHSVNILCCILLLLLLLIGYVSHAFCC